MRALTLPAYGAPRLGEIAPPRPKAGEVLIDVVSASVNAADLHLSEGRPFPVRFVTGLRTPKLGALGADVAGRVREVGAGVTGLAVGDGVVADLSGSGFGAFAEQVCAPEGV